jgi:predicted kinase
VIDVPKEHTSKLAYLLRKLLTEEASRGSVLVVLCGPTHAGKTTFARRLRSSYRIVSSDDIRKEFAGCFNPEETEEKVWKVFDSMKRQWLKEGHNVILDACHTTKRARWHALQGPNEQHRKICVVFDLPLKTIRERCLKTKRMLPEEAEKMWRAFWHNKPTVQELEDLGFEEVYISK